MKSPLSSIGEFGLIEQLRKNVHLSKDVVLGIGDDAAVLKYDDSRGDVYQLFTTDMMIEDVHFTRKMNACFIGHKALACNISDIAAMGGVPTAAVVSLGVPADLEIRFVKEIYQGMNALARRFAVSIVGGDTVKSQKVIINVALLGKVKKKEMVFRSGARSGDMIFVTGPLGRSFQSGKHLKFMPRVVESQFLVKNFKPTSMIDISDGLISDLAHILKKSRAGALLRASMIPRTKGASLQEALCDGEDYELLFTLKKRQARRALAFPFHVYSIGEVVDSPKKCVIMTPHGKEISISCAGYKHF